MPLQAYQALSVDPESTAAAMLNNASPIMEPGSVVWKNGRSYLYVLVDSGATVPPNGGFVAYKAAPTSTTFTVTNVANGLSNTSDHNCLVAGMVYYQITAGNYGFIQVGGVSFVAALLDPGVGRIGQIVVGNVTNTTTPAQGVLATTSNLIFSTVVGQTLATPSGQAGSIFLTISPFCGA